MMGITMDEKQFIRDFKVFQQGAIDVFLGAGASFSSGIPTGSYLTWYFKREIYCSENCISQERFKDLQSESSRTILQEYFNNQTGYPALGDPQEYSFYFEKCYSTWSARKDFIDSLVSKKSPAIGYLCLASLLVDSKVDNIWTTNFDELTETAIHSVDSLFPINVLSSANKSSFSNINPTYCCLYKLHGDYRYDRLLNTSDELKTLEKEIENQFYNKLQNKGLLVIGYSGSDDSVMGTFEKYILDGKFLSKGLYWTTIKGNPVSDRVKNLIARLNSQGKHSSIIEIESFDSFLLNIYYAIGNRLDIIDKQISFREKRKKLIFNLKKPNYFIKLNSFEVRNCPNCNVFETDIKDWVTLKKYRDDLIAALFNGHIYCFASAEQIIKKFGEHVKSEIVSQEIPQSIVNRINSIYTGMLYELIGKALNEAGLTQYGRSKFYEASSVVREKEYMVYNAIEMSLDVIDGKYYLNISPTFHITNLNGCELDKLTYQKQLNSKSNIYNKQYNEILGYWQKKLITKGKLIFEYNSFSVEFCVPAVSCGGVNRNPQWPTVDVFCADEPAMVFSNNNKKFNSINQLKGLIKYGPIDCSFAQSNITRSPIKLGIISPDKVIDSVLAHLNALNLRQANDGKDSFCQTTKDLQIYIKEVCRYQIKMIKVCAQSITKKKCILIQHSNLLNL